MAGQVIQLRKAQRKKAFLKLGISGASGSGKTAGSLLIAYGLMKQKYPDMQPEELWRKIAIIDTENGSGELYVNKAIGGVLIGEYNVIPIQPPFDIDKYITAIDVCRNASMEVCIIDSTTHAWSGTGGLLEQQNVASKKSNNPWTAWRDITPKHNMFVESMLQTPMHIIATMRAKQEYVQTRDSNGNVTVKKLGMEPEQRKGMEYEFTVFLEVDSAHNAFGAKDRTGLVDQKEFKIGPKVGMELMEWLESGVDTSSQTLIAESEVKHNNSTAEEKKIEHKEKEEVKNPVADKAASVVALCKTLDARNNTDVQDIIKEYTLKYANVESMNPNVIKDIEGLTLLESKLKEYSETLSKTE